MKELPVNVSKSGRNLNCFNTTQAQNGMLPSSQSHLHLPICDISKILVRILAASPLVLRRLEHKATPHDDST
jgi:hypothetical protein